MKQQTEGLYLDEKLVSIVNVIPIDVKDLLQRRENFRQRCSRIPENN